MDERVSAVEGKRCFQVLFRELVLSFPKVIKGQVLMRIREPGVEADGGFVIFVGRVDAAEFGFCDADKVLERGIRRPQAPRSLKLFERCLVFPLLKELQAAVAANRPVQMQPRKKKRRQLRVTRRFIALRILALSFAFRREPGLRA